MDKKITQDAKRRTIWISDELWAKMCACAENDERTVSAWVRRVIEKSLK